MAQFDSLWVTVGVPGSGKSTWADKNVPTDRCRLERDRFREAIFGSRMAFFDHPFSRQHKSLVIGSAMAAAASNWPTKKIAMTDTGTAFGAVQWWVRRSKSVRIFVFDVPDEVIWERNRTRPEEHRVPDEILASFIHDFRDPEAWWRSYRSIEYVRP